MNIAYLYIYIYIWFFFGQPAYNSPGVQKAMSFFGTVQEQTLHNSGVTVCRPFHILFLHVSVLTLSLVIATVVVLLC